MRALGVGGAVEDLGDNAVPPHPRGYLDLLELLNVPGGFKHERKWKEQNETQQTELTSRTNRDHQLERHTGEDCTGLVNRNAAAERGTPVSIHKIKNTIRGQN